MTRPPAVETSRTVATEALVQVVGGGHSLSKSLPPLLARLGDRRERALAQELTYGVLRGLIRLDAILAALLERPLRDKDTDVRVLLLLGLYQLLAMRIPDRAAVAATVETVRLRGKPWATGLVNGVLRRFQREGDTLLAAVDADPATALAHPTWLHEQIAAAWPDDSRSIMRANNDRPPMTLRVNRGRQTRDAYRQILTDEGLISQPAPHTEEGLTLENAMDVSRLPGFREGWVSVQDGASQLAPDVLALAPGQRVLDACAAPGGKTGHLLEREPRLEAVLALDIDAGRLERIAENLDRLGLAAQSVHGDAGEPRDWWDGVPFQRILLDAPCSATGVIRRHPDIKLHRQPADIERLVGQQQRLLEALWGLLAPGGRLLYATCSVLPQENQCQVEGFLERHRDATALPITSAWGRSLPNGRQILTGNDDMDGFGYALLRKD